MWVPFESKRHMHPCENLNVVGLILWSNVTVPNEKVQHNWSRMVN